jgi:hypothetical protein
MNRTINGALLDRRINELDRDIQKLENLFLQSGMSLK